MAMIKYILFFVIILVVVNLFVFFYISGINVFSPLGGWYASLVGRYSFLKDPLVTLSIVSLVILALVAIVMIKVSEKT